MGLNPDKNGRHAARRARANRNGLASSSLALASRTFQVAQVDKVGASLLGPLNAETAGRWACLTILDMWLV